jgi:A/G-specific adenine glycosylase
VKKAEITQFQKTIWDFYKKQGRHDLPWRQTSDPYKILVSEVMLQQTQVDRVVPKYTAFLKQFPTVQALAKAPLQELLLAWSGLGYNRRVLYLQRGAQAVVGDFKGVFPKDPEVLETLPGVGPYTARAVATFSFDAPYVFIETNIRRVFIHAFFPRDGKVSDAELIPYIEASLPTRKSAKEWYWALMDYGSYLKSTIKNPNQRSVHYTKQSMFKGSVRELRGVFLHKCTQGSVSKKELFKPYIKDIERAEKALAGLVRDGLVTIDSKGYVKIRE